MQMQHQTGYEERYKNKKETEYPKEITRNYVGPHIDDGQRSSSVFSVGHWRGSTGCRSDEQFCSAVRGSARDASEDEPLLCEIDVQSIEARRVPAGEGPRHTVYTVRGTCAPLPRTGAARLEPGLEHPKSLPAKLAQARAHWHSGFRLSWAVADSLFEKKC